MYIKNIKKRHKQFQKCFTLKKDKNEFSDSFFAPQRGIKFIVVHRPERKSTCEAFWRVLKEKEGGRDSTKWNFSV